MQHDPDAPRHAVTGEPAGRPTHADRPTVGLRRPVLLAAGLAALGAAAVWALHSPGPVPSAPSSARTITAMPTVPLAPADLAALTAVPPDAGALADPERRASCLAGLGRADARVLGARVIDVDGRPAVVLVLSGEQGDPLRAVAVRPDCALGQPGLIAEQVLPRP